MFTKSWAEDNMMNSMEVSGFVSGGEEVLFVVELVQTLRGADE